jgi:TPP-dependent pyruvate/acetoin dehydrogenase alpha subunit
MFEYWRRRDPITRLENYLINTRKWLSREENQKLISQVEQYLEQEREIAVNSPMPTAESAEGGVYCDDSCHQIKPKYAMPKTRQAKSSSARKKEREAALHFR